MMSAQQRLALSLTCLTMREAVLHSLPFCLTWKDAYLESFGNTTSKIFKRYEQRQDHEINVLIFVEQSFPKEGLVRGLMSLRA